VILLLRHARAGRSGQAGPDDSLRPLDEKGRRQARALPELLAAYEIRRILTSPFARCLETVEPLSAALGIAVEQRAELAEGAGDEADRLVTSLDDGALVCTHGDVIARLIGSGRRAHKGSVWLLQPYTLEPVEYLRARV
jgi:8-oxo-dGTP diphosphatase